MELEASYVTKPSQPSFAAYRNQSTWNVNGAVMVFNSTRHNTGGHYNTSNGRFTAPIVLIVAALTAPAVAIRIGSGITLVDPNFVGILPPRCRCSLAT